MQLYNTLSFYYISILIKNLCRKVLPAVLLFLICSSLSAQDIMINEVMASNSRSIMDEDEEYPDWIELYNAGTEDVNLNGFGLSDDESRPFRWELPDTTLQSGGFLLVWASGKDRRNPGSPLHTNYNVDADGEPVLLTAPEGERLDELDPTAIPTDVTYGRQQDGSSTWAFFNEPTPEASNNAAQALEPAIGEPVFSHSGGFYTNAFNLTLNTDYPDAEIIYTLDGSEPDPDNLDGQTYTYKNQYQESGFATDGELLEGSYQSMTYDSSIEIVNRENEPDHLTQISSTYDENPDYMPSSPVFKGTTVRARLVQDGHLPGPIVSKTYFVTPEGQDRYSFPVVSISIQEDHLFGYQDGIYVAGEDFDAWRDENGFQFADGGSPANYQRRGDIAEKPAHIQYFVQDEGIALDQNFGLRIHGGWSRSEPLKSFRLYAKNSYGRPFFEYPLFSEQEDDAYKRFMLRNSGNDMWTTLLRDAAIQEIADPLIVDMQAHQPTVTFVNGEYWGILNARERYDKFYLARTYDTNPEQVDLLANDSEVSAGSAGHYEETLTYIEENDLSEEEHYEYIKTRIDVEDFIDFQIIHIFSDNTDWPGNNTRYWRYQADSYNPDAPHGLDGRWRWLLFDTDFGFALYEGQSDIENNTLEMATDPNSDEWPNPTWATFLLRNLLENETFETSFINRYTTLLNTAFRPERMIRIINEFEQWYAPEIEEHMHRWGAFSGDINEWHNNVDDMRAFANQREEHVRQHIRDYFGLGEDVAVSFDVSDPEHGHIRVNALDIHDDTEGLSDDVYPFDGVYFAGMPVELEAIAQPGYRFAGWAGTDNDSASAAFTPQSDTTITAVFEPDTGAHLLHYWNLNELSAPYAPSYTYAEAALDVNEGDDTDINLVTGGGFEGENARLGDDPGRHFYAEHTEGTTIEFTFTTTGYEEIILHYELTGSGPQTISYIDKTSEETLFRQIELSGQSPFVYTLDFSDTEAARNNPEFTVRMTFDQAGSFRFDNFTVEGSEIEGANLPPVIADSLPEISLIEHATPDTLSLENLFEDPDLDQLSFSVIDSGQVNAEIYNGNQLIITPQNRGGGHITIYADDGQHQLVGYDISLLVYPEARILYDADFVFEEWSAEEPEYTYPEHMLFLQSDLDDPEVDDPLSFPYHIKPDEYHNDDGHAIGYPYQATRRTRLNGLGEDGISLINTGRERDLGGVLLAINTKDITTLRAEWIVGTLLRNSRMYGLALFYRIGTSGDFQPVGNNTSSFYQARYDGHEEQVDATLPEEVYDESYVQLLWRYYHINGNDGPRAQLRLDDITIGSVPGTTEINDVSYAENDDITISWLSSYGATHYDVEIASDSTFNNVLQEHTSLEEQELLLTGLPEDTIVYVRVRGVANEENGPWYTDSLPTKEPVVTTTSSSEEVTPVRVYPNPAKGHITLHFGGKTPDRAKVTVYDHSGRVVLQHDNIFQDKEGKPEKTLDMTRLQAGTYILSIEQDEDITRENIILLE